MKTMDRVNMVKSLAEGVCDSLSVYCAAKGDRPYPPYAGCDVPMEHCKESIKRRITVIREELLNISKEL